MGFLIFIVGFVIYRKHQQNQKLKQAVQESNENIDGDGLLK